MGSGGGAGIRKAGVKVGLFRFWIFFFASCLFYFIEVIGKGIISPLTLV